MEDRLEVVPVGVLHVGRVVAGVVLGTQPRPAVVGSTGRKRRSVERLHPGLVFGVQGKVDGRGGSSMVQPQLWLPGEAEADRTWELQDDAEPERLERRRVEGLGSRQIAYRQTEVIDHVRGFPASHAPTLADESHPSGSS